MEPSTSAGFKRKCISPNQEEAPIATKLKIDTSVSILDLSDCILLEILKFLDATSLYLLGETCSRLSNLVQDQSLWIHIEARSEPNTFEKVGFCWKNAGPKTRSLKLSGNIRSKVLLSSKILDSNTLSSLTVLALEHQTIKYVSDNELNEFPSSLKEISFRHSYIPNHPLFFRYSEKQMANLRVLILDHCKWLDANSFTSWSKYPKLEILSLYMCKKLTEDEIANVTLAGTTGFRTLKVADLRFTAFGEVFIRTFYSNPSIQIIYFQCYGTSYVTERYKRKLDIINGVKMKEYSYMSDDEENNTDQDWVRKHFNADKTQKYQTQTIKDNTMIVYKRTQKVKGDRDRPTTLLYKYPYEVCTCGFYSKPTHTSVQRAKTSWDADEIKTKLDDEVARQRENKADMKGGEIYFIRPNDSKLCSKIAYDSCMMPDWCHVEASPSACIHKWLFKRTPRNDFEISMAEHVDKHYLSQFKHRCTMGTPCVCLLTPLSPNSILVRAPEVETCSMSLTYHQGHGVQGQYHNEKLLRIVASYIMDIKNSDDSEKTAQQVAPSIIRSIIDSVEESETYDILEDDEFSNEICRIIHDLAMIIEFDVFHVIAHHSCCFDDLNRHISGRCDVKECFKFFFANLINTVRIDFAHKVVESDAGELQLNREELEREELSPRLEYRDSGLLRINAFELENIIQIRPNFCGVNVINQRNVGKEFTTVLRELSLRGYTCVTDLTLMVLKDLDLGLLDVTAFGEVFIHNFYSNPSIQIIYFQCYGTTYVTERYMRKLDIINGDKMKEYSRMSDDEENNTDQDWIRKRFNAKKTQKYHTQTIKDNTMIVYKQTQKIRGDRDRPSSVLYKYPYDVCTCGFYSKPTHTSVKPSNTSRYADEIKTKLDEEMARQHENKVDMKGGEIYFIRPNDSKLCNKIAYDSCLMPDWCHIEASASACIHKWLYKRAPRNDFEISMTEHVDKHYLSQFTRMCALGTPCACLLTPLCSNSIVAQSLEDDIRITFNYRQDHGLQGKYHNDKLLRIVANYITDIKNSNDSEMTAQQVGPSIIRSIIDTDQKLKTYEIFTDDQFLKEICGIIHDLAMIIEFDVFHVIAYHSCCFDDLNRHISGRCDVKESLKFFFVNFINSVRNDFYSKVAEIDSGALQLDREELERHELSPRLGYTDRRLWHINAIELENILQIHPQFCDQRNNVKEFTTVLGELSLRGYTHITDRTLMVLKDLDLRLLDVTAFGEWTILIFYTNPSIQVIYCQCYGTTYLTERYKRKLDIINGVEMKEYSHMSDDEDNNIDEDSVQKRFNTKRTRQYDTQTIDDDAMVIYKRSQKIKGDHDRPRSVLYKYPYEVCTCGFYAQPTHTNVQRAKTSWDADEIKTKLDHEVARQRENKIHKEGGEIYFFYPNESKFEASASACIHKWLYKRTPRNDFEISMIEDVEKFYLNRFGNICHFHIPCACLQTPLYANSINMRRPKVETFLSIAHRQGRNVEGQYLNEKLLRIVANYITDIRNSDDTEKTAQQVGPSIIRSIIDRHRGLKIYKILEDGQFLKEICGIIHDLAMLIEFDVFRVIAHHSRCFDDLNRHITARCDTKECLKYFFTNLMNSVRNDFHLKVTEIDSNESQLDREKVEHEKLSHLGVMSDEEIVNIDGEFMTRYSENVKKKFMTLLGELSLRGYTEVTDLTLNVLKDLELKLLDVTGTNVTAEGVEQFLTYNPECWLIHETTCVCRPNLHF
ncbi:hypothetical protein FQR65_LT06921 [Abscondita terminalis]|nr:hypothetical protein FQR65_LT06921 [Abscondita terminalis]